MAKLRYAVLGTGFWANFQIAAWNEVGGVELVALYNRTVSKAEKMAQKFGAPSVYGDPEELLSHEQLDFIDIITEIDAHEPLVLLAAKYQVPVICQKPMAPNLETAEKMVAACQQAGIPFFIHENFRWQTPIRAVKEALDSGEIGVPFRARVELISGYPVFQNQPFLRTLEHFIITDLGSHLLDVSRFLFGEAERLYCQTEQVHANIAGEDVATILLRMKTGPEVLVRMAYAENFLEHDSFPQTTMFIEGSQGSIELAPGGWLRLTNKLGTHARRVPSPRYPWADPDYDLVHASIVPCNADILQDLNGARKAETSAEDNLKTVRLVFASYESAASCHSISLDSFHPETKPET